MSEQMLHDDALEQRLRAHYTSEYGQPPAPSAIWEGISAQLVAATTTRERADAEHPDWTAGATSDHPLPLQPATPHDKRPWPRRLLPLVAAAIVVVVFATLLLGPLGRSGRGLTGAKGTATVEGPTATPIPVHALTRSEVFSGMSINDVQMLSPDDGWAVGGQRPSGGCGLNTNQPCESLILHFSGGRWQQVGGPLPNVEWRTLSMASATDGWIGGMALDQTSGSLSSVFLHYVNGLWTEVNVPGMQSDQIFKIKMLSADEGWAIAARQGPADAWNPFFLWHYSRGVWFPVDDPGSKVITLSMVSPTEGWAAGTYDILRYQNGHWAPWGQKAPGVVTAIQMVSTTDGWMAGIAPDGGTTDKSHHLFMLHYDGHSWQPVQLPSLPEQSGASLVSEIFAIEMVSPSEGWAVGDVGGGYSIILHYAQGVWRLDGLTVSEPLRGISMLSPDEGWAVGAERNLAANVAAGVMLHYSHGVWSVYKP